MVFGWGILTLGAIDYYRNWTFGP